MQTLSKPIPGARVALPPSPKKVWTERELMALPKDDGKYELVNGELTLMSPAGYEHGDVSAEIVCRLRPFVKKHKLGRVLDGQTGFWMKSGNVLSPDVSFVSNEREGKLECLPTGFFNGAPDLAVEVLSPSERMKDVDAKIADYFASGTQLVWVVKPKTQSARAYRGPGSYVLLGIADSLDGENVVPGFRLPLRELFEND